MGLLGGIWGNIIFGVTLVVLMLLVMLELVGVWFFFFSVRMEHVQRVSGRGHNQIAISYIHCKSGAQVGLLIDSPTARLRYDGRAM